MDMRMRTVVHLGAAGWLVALGLGASILALASPAGADLTTDSADCRGEVVVTGDAGTNTTITQSSTQVTVDAQGSYSGTGSVFGGGEGEERSYAGAVKIDLPAPFPDYGPAQWAWSNDASKKYASEDPKSGSYDLPSFVPRGFYVPLIGTHAENGDTVCVFEGEVKVSGSFTDSPISIGAAVGTLIFGGMATAAGLARKEGV
jgi:hypothetical protein